MGGKSEEDLVSLLQRSFRLTAYEAKYISHYLREPLLLKKPVP